MKLSVVKKYVWKPIIFFASLIQYTMHREYVVYLHPIHWVFSPEITHLIRAVFTEFYIDAATAVSLQLKFFSFYFFFCSWKIG